MNSGLLPARRTWEFILRFEREALLHKHPCHLLQIASELPFSVPHDDFLCKPEDVIARVLLRSGGIPASLGQLRIYRPQRITPNNRLERDEAFSLDVFVPDYADRPVYSDHDKAVASHSRENLDFAEE